MKVSDIVLEMELGGVDAADIADIVTICKDKGFTTEILDEELLNRGYEKIFTVNYDDYDDYDEWQDDEYMSVEKFSHKQQYSD